VTVAGCGTLHPARLRPPRGLKYRTSSATYRQPVSASSNSVSSSPASFQPVSIRQEDLIQSIADALQYISYYHPVDYIKNLAAAYEREESPAAKDAIAQILINSRMCA
jgi:fumarate hydratase, class I